MFRIALTAGLAVLGLIATAPRAQAANIVSQSRSANVYAYTFDYHFGDVSRQDSDSASSTAAGTFDPSLDAFAGLMSGGAYATAEQDTTIDAAALSFRGGGTAAGGVYVQATGYPSTLGQSETTFEMTFQLTKAGVISLYAYVEGSTPGQGDSADALASVQIINVNTGAVVFSKSAANGEWDEFDDQIDLAAGTYKLVATAAVDATSGAGGEVYEEGRADFWISGSIFEI